jgi:predicted alpha/beta superfamily hydrolase
MHKWRTYTDEHPNHTVVGNLQWLKKFRSPQLRNQRDLFVWLPASYSEGQRRYPVIYMHDGQNLFDQALSYAGEWRVDETMSELGAQHEAIIVGIANAGRHRLDEYSPFRDTRLAAGGAGDAYLAFVCETVKPMIDREFRTLPGRAHTGLIGSSMGGLISLYALFRRPETFGFIGAFSPSIWFAEHAILEYVAAAPFVPSTIYLDMGTHEGRDDTDVDPDTATAPSRHLLDTRQMHSLLLQKGYRDEVDLRYVEDHGAGHHESAWARRLPNALRFLLSRPST